MGFIKLRLRWCVVLALLIESVSLIFGPIKDLIIWRYPTTLFKPSLSYSSQIIDDPFRTKVDNYTIVSPLGLETIAIEFPNLRLGADIAMRLGYDYNAENTWSQRLGPATTSRSSSSPWTTTTLLTKLETIVASSDATVRSQFYTTCSSVIARMSTGETQCWYPDHRATTVEELLWYLVNQLNPHPPGVVFGTIAQNARAGDNISATIETSANAKFAFSLFYGGESFGFGDAHMTNSVSKFLSSALIPAVSNSVEAYLCLADENMDDLFFGTIASDPTHPLNKYLYAKHAADPAYLSKLLLPEYQAGLQTCRQQQTLADRIQWLTTEGSLRDIWPRVTFDSVAELLVKVVETQGLLSQDQVATIKSTKFQYPGRPYIYDDKRTKWTILGQKALQVNATKKITFTVLFASKTYSWRRVLLSDWYYHGIERVVLPTAVDYIAHNYSEITFTNANKDDIASHKVRHYSFAAAAAFTGCNPRTQDCATVPDINDKYRWNGTVFNSWTEVGIPQPIYPDQQLYTDVASFEELILTLRAVISYPTIAVDMDNSFARPTAITTTFRNYILADIAGLMDGALPFLTTHSLKMGVLEPDISITQAKSFYLQNFLNPSVNLLAIGRPLFLRSRLAAIPYLPFEPDVNRNLSVPMIMNFVDLACAWDRGYGSTYMYFKIRDQNGQCVQRLGPTTANAERNQQLVVAFGATAKGTPQDTADALTLAIERWERATNTNVNNSIQQSVMASYYPQYRLSPGWVHRGQAWRCVTHLFGRGLNSRHIPANAYHLNMQAGQKYQTNGFYMDLSMEGAYKMLTFVAIITSFATAMFSLAFIVVPAIISVLRATDVEISKDDFSALWTMDMACSSYSSTIMLPFNVLAGLIPVMEILALDPHATTSRRVGSVIAVFLCSWRFGIAVLQIATDLTLPSRNSWALAGMVTGIFYLIIYAGLGEEFEIYSRAIVVTFANFAICTIIVYPALQWYKRRYASIIANSSVNHVVNRDIIYISKSGLVYTGNLEGEEARETEAYITSTYGHDQVVTKHDAKMTNFAKHVHAYKIALPSLTHALEAAARHKKAIWVDFATRSVRGLFDKNKPARHQTVSGDPSRQALQKHYSPLAIV